MRFTAQLSNNSICFMHTIKQASVGLQMLGRQVNLCWGHIAAFFEECILKLSGKEMARDLNGCKSLSLAMAWYVKQIYVDSA